MIVQKCSRSLDTYPILAGRHLDCEIGGVKYVIQGVSDSVLLNGRSTPMLFSMICPSG